MIKYSNIIIIIIMYYIYKERKKRIKLINSISNRTLFDIHRI